MNNTPRIQGQHEASCALQVRDIAKTSWEDVRDGPQIEQSYFERDTELCCNEDELRWGKDDMGCTTRSFLHPNFTAMAFPDFATM